MGINAYLTWYWLGNPQNGPHLRVHGRNVNGLRAGGQQLWLDMGYWILDNNTPFG